MAHLKKVSVFAPATVANVGSGFDILGLALDGLGDELTLEETDKSGLTLTVESESGANLPAVPEKNCATVPILRMAEKFGLELKAHATLIKKMPIGSGLGSSAASAVAGAFAANEFLQLGLSRSELVSYAVLGEEAACGVGHADNVAPSLLGGFVVVQSYEPLKLFKLNNRIKDLWVSVVHPDVVVKTEDARKALPSSYKLETVVAQMGHLATLINGLVSGDATMLQYGTEDLIAQPYRSKLIPGYDAAKHAALGSGALAFGISGSGPSVFALIQGEEKAHTITSAMAKQFEDINLKTRTITSAVNDAGARLLTKD